MGLSVSFGNSVIEQHHSAKKNNFGTIPKLNKSSQISNDVDYVSKPTSSIAIDVALGALATTGIVVAAISGGKTKALKETLDKLSKEVGNSVNQKQLNEAISNSNQKTFSYLTGLEDRLHNNVQNYHGVKTTDYERAKTNPIWGNDFWFAAEKGLNYSMELIQELRDTASKFLLAKTNGIKEANLAINKAFKKDTHYIRIPTTEYHGIYKSGGMGAVPRELMTNLIALTNGKGKNVKGIVDMPMYIGTKLEKNADLVVKVHEDNPNLFDYVKFVKKDNGNIEENFLARNMKKEVQEIEIYENGKINKHKVEIYTTDEIGPFRKVKDIKTGKETIEKVDDSVNYDLLKEQMEELNPKLAKKVEQMADNSTMKIGSLEFIKNEGKIKVKVHYQAKFYKDEAFIMQGGNPNQFNAYGTTYNNTERERFAYFSKIFYESLMAPEKLKANNGKAIQADTIIGNDWQTGAISALFRLLTPIRASLGEIPKEYEVYKNIPIQTILHNTCLSGQNLDYYGSLKTIEALFGKHSALVVDNAWMPQKGFDGKYLNGLFYEDEADLQTMAAVYSNVLTPVSKGNAGEIVLENFEPATNKLMPIYKLRADACKDTPNEEKTIFGITNGCDKINNLLTTSKTKDIHKFLNLEEDLKPMPEKGFKTKEEAFAWHQHNKGVILRHYAKEHDKRTNVTDNPLKLFDDPKLTSFEGVNENTTVYVMAGRISDQKGVNNLHDSILIFCQKNAESLKSDNPPLFFIQGKGASPEEEKKIMTDLINAKNEIRKLYGDKAANRIVLSNFFSEPGRYDACRLMGDFSLMPSNFEPCGLVQKEIEYFSGAIPVVYKNGGLSDGYTTEGKFKNIFAADYTHGLRDPFNQNRWNFAQAMSDALAMVKKGELAQWIYDATKVDFSWLKGKTAPTREYDSLLHISEIAPDLAIAA